MLTHGVLGVEWSTYRIGCLTTYTARAEHRADTTFKTQLLGYQRWLVPMNFQDKQQYQEIYPLKLATDISTAVLSGLIGSFAGGSSTTKSEII
jgi:hypothetical protein